MVDWRLRIAAWVTEKTSTPTEALPPPRARAQMSTTIRATTPWLLGRPARVASVEDRPIASVPTRVYRHGAGAAPAVVYFHGGGWVVGGLDTHDGVCRALASQTGATVISVDYRLAPEHAFPAAFDDAVAVTRFVAANGKELGLSPGVVAVAGDSAGGNLAAAVALRARDEAIALRGQLLVYPVTDCAAESSSYADFATGHFLTRETMRYFVRQYLPRHEDRRRPEASPLHAPSAAGVAPAFVVTAEADVLRDEGRAYAEKLRREGVAVEHAEGTGMLHGFFSMLALRIPREVMARATQWLTARLA